MSSITIPIASSKAYRQPAAGVNSQQLSAGYRGLSVSSGQTAVSCQGVSNQTRGMSN
jgi:hypothetical protein